MRNRARVALFFLVALAVLAIGTPSAWSNERRDPCPGARWVIVDHGSLLDDLIGGDADAILIGQPEGTMAIRSGCAPTPARTRVSRRGTQVTAKWDRCGTSDRVRLRVKIDSTCSEMSGQFKRKGGRRIKFTAIPLPISSLGVDQTLSPRVTELPAVDGEARPVAALAVADGVQSEFVVNELLVNTNDRAKLDRLLDRTNGTVIDYLPAEVAGEANLYLVRVRAPVANPDDVVAKLEAIELSDGSNLRVSDPRGVDLLGSAADAKLEGIEIGLNWLGDGADIASGSTADATAPDGFGNDAFRWPYMNRGSVQNIGTTEAWRVLDQTGRDANRVRIAIIDSGFGSADLLGRTWFNATNDETAQPSGRGVDTFHGQLVAEAAMGVIDNGASAAGVAGQVGVPILIESDLTTASAVRALRIARRSGAAIINMSFGGELAKGLFWTANPFKFEVFRARAAGILVFASAGNDGQNVDTKNCGPFGKVCWEKRLYYPCEFDGVTCVGGLAWDSKSRDPGSNFGARSVDIFAPFTVFAGPTPDDAAVQSVSGTSFASPYTAGVAAVMMAANPARTPDEIEELLIATAQTSPDSEVGRYVNAYIGVLASLESFPPEVRILSPSDNAELTAGRLIGLSASALDREDGTIAVVWSSDREGTLGTGNPLVGVNLSAGVHLLTACVADRSGLRTCDSVRVTVVDQVPIVNLLEPAAAAILYAGDPLRLLASSYDANEPGFELADDRIQWSSSIDGDLGRGHEIFVRLSAGRHVLRVSGRDSAGGESTDQVHVTVEYVGFDLPPDVSIDEPNADLTITGWDGWDAQKKSWYVDVVLQGHASDPEDGTLSGASLVWRTDRTDLQSEILMTGGSLYGVLDTIWGPILTIQPVRLYGNACGDTHRVTLTATDSTGNSSSAIRWIRVNSLC